MKESGATDGPADAARYAPFETMRYDPATRDIGGHGGHGGPATAVAPGFVRFERHLARWERSCTWLGLDLDHQRVLAALNAAVAGLTTAHRVRMTLTATGAVAVSFTPLPQPRFNDTPEQAMAAASTVVAAGGVLGKAALARQRVDETDPARAHKTTARELYYAARSYAERNGLDDVLFLDTRGRLAEGSISSVFLVADDSGAAVTTPPLTSGALPGVLREELVERGLVQVRELGEAELRGAGAVLLGSSVRGLRRVVLESGLVDVG